nr:hypothetical protein FFPRI1PSEUD_64940 [Pseudomonas sp. FFPRI_1]
MKVDFGDVLRVLSEQCSSLTAGVMEASHMPLVEVLLFWIVGVSVSGAFVMGVRTRTGMMLGFFFSISSAALIMFYLSASGFELKQKNAKLEASIAQFNGQIAVIEKSSSGPMDASQQPIDYRKKVFQYTEQIKENSGAQEFALVLTNFVIMTLGGLGAGLLAALLTLKPEVDEAAVEDACKLKLLHVFEYVCSFIFITTSLSMIVVFVRVEGEVIDRFIKALIEGAVAIVLVLPGFLRISWSIERKRHNVLILTFYMLLITYFYIQSMRFLVPYQPIASAVVATLALVSFGAVRRRLHLPF